MMLWLIDVIFAPIWFKNCKFFDSDSISDSTIADSDYDSNCRVYHKPWFRFWIQGFRKILILIPIPASCDSNPISNKPSFDSDSDSGIIYNSGLRIKPFTDQWLMFVKGRHVEHPWTQILKLYFIRTVNYNPRIPNKIKKLERNV